MFSLLRRLNLGTALREAPRTLRRFGFWRTLRIVRSRLADYLFDIRYGTDTREMIELEQLGDLGAERAHGSRYQPIDASALLAVLRFAGVAADDVLVDYGCGKGRALLLAARHGCRQVRGIEFSRTLCEIAQSNRAILERKEGRSLPVEILHLDARQYLPRGDDSVFYFFHPFGPEILAPVLANILASLRDHPRHAKLIYYYPVHREVFDGCPALVLSGSVIAGGYECLVYRFREISTT